MSEPAPDPASCGERIELLLEASAAAGPVARERAEELVRIVVDLYGAGLERLLELVHERGALDDELVEALADDELVSSLLLVHDLHPFGVQQRVERALARVRPTLDSRGGQVRLIEVTGDGVVRLQLQGGHGCSSTSAPVELAVQDAIRAAAPEVVRIDIDQPVAAPSVIPVEQLTSRLRAAAVDA